jgi:protoheme IX farnesyltransferase
VAEQRIATPSELAPVASAGDFFALLKPRVMSLVIFTGLAGIIAAPGHIHPTIAFVALMCIAVGAGAAGALNMWYERDIDALMERTRDRPLPAGRMEPGAALGFGSVLAVGSVSLMALGVNWVAAVLLALTILFYVFVYTIWLKPRTPQNIVIGGAAGALAPAVGWAAVTGGIDAGALALFLIVFMWTPPHFWALALYKRGEYDRAGIPMLPVVAGERETRKQILIYTVLLAPVAMSPWALGFAGALYGVVAAALSVLFIAAAWRLWIETRELAARRLFGFSIAYLFVLFLALIVDRLAGFAA